MEIRNVSADQLVAAVERVNGERYEGNVTVRCDLRDTRVGWRGRFRLGVNDSRGPGGSVNPITGRYVSAACWHAHGYVFDEILARCPDAVIVVGFGGGIDGKVTRDGGNWVDYPRGSMAFPWFASEGCDCR